MDKVNPDIIEFIKNTLSPLLAVRVLRELRQKREEQAKDTK